MEEQMAMNDLVAYHGDPALKAEFVSRMKAHIAADQLRQGATGGNGRGCAVWCTYDEYDHAIGQERLGFPEWYERLRDAIFEGLPKNDAPAFALASLEDVPVGADIDLARVPFLIAIQKRNLERMKDAPEPYGSACRDAVAKVIEWLEDGAAESASWAARSSAQSAAWVARSAAPAAWVARSAEESAACVALSASWAARSAAAESARLAALAAALARSAAAAAEYRLQAAELLTQLRALRTAATREALND
jgi:hypothetical protein